MSRFNKGDKYTCANCQMEFVCPKDYADMVAEYEILVGKEYTEEDTEIICDACYKEYKALGSFNTSSPIILIIDPIEEEEQPNSN